MILFSIVIPIYNVEKYIRSVIDSVLNQAFKNYEIILVDDGSTDSCGDICDEYAKKNENIKVIHKENGGLGSARNAGFYESAGKYVYFLDGDDRLCENILSLVSEQIKGKEIPDVIASQYHLYTDWNITYKRIEKLLISDSISLSKKKLYLAISSYVSNNFYNREFLLKNNRMFTEKKMVSEDNEWHFYNICHAKNIIVVNKAFYYHYEMRQGSQMNFKKPEFYIPTLQAWFNMYYSYENLPYDEEIRIELKHRLCSTLSRTVADFFCNCPYKSVRNACRLYIKENFIVLLDNANKMSVLIKILSLFGKSTALFIIDKIYKHKNKKMKKQRGKLFK